MVLVTTDPLTSLVYYSNVIRKKRKAEYRLKAKSTKKKGKARV